VLRITKWWWWWYISIYFIYLEDLERCSSAVLGSGDHVFAVLVFARFVALVSGIRYRSSVTIIDFKLETSLRKRMMVSELNAG
jgi:hypothetical protein